MQVGTLSVTPNGVAVDVKWTITDFWSFNQIQISSPKFAFNGQTWWLGIWPNGCAYRGSFGYVDLWLHFGNRRVYPINLEFSLSFKTANGEKYMEAHAKELFEFLGHKHGFERFISRLELSKRHRKLVPFGALTVICTMKSIIIGVQELSNDEINIAFRSKVTRANKSVARRSNQIGAVQAAASGQSFRKSNNNSTSLKCLKENRKEISTQTQEGKNDESLCQDFKKMLLEGQHHDIILKVGDREFRVHRDVLRARSRVFESMLDHDMKEKNTDSIHIEDCDSEAMEQFLSFIYSGTVDNLDQSSMFNLYYIADKYDVKNLKDACRDFIQKSLSLRNICEVIQLALMHSDSNLLGNATEYFMANVLEIMSTVEWQAFLKENSTVGNELLMKSIKKLKNA